VGHGPDPITLQSANTLGQVAARELASEGKKGVQSDDAYGIWWNADVMGYNTFIGTSLFLTEIASVRDLAYPYKSADGSPLGSQNKTIRNLTPYDSDTWTLEQIVDYAKTGAYAGIKHVADNPTSWLYNNLYLTTKNGTNLPDVVDGAPEAYVIPAGQRDPFATYEMLKLFEFGRAEIERARTAFTAGGKTYPA
ncbi:hypothetical protein ACFQ07_08850, partial [Actinomadura adrarensis]